MTESRLNIVQICLLAIGMLRSCSGGVSEAMRNVVLELREAMRKTTIIKVRTTRE
jgi:hypothetical protein